NGSLVSRKFGGGIKVDFAQRNRADRHFFVGMSFPLIQSTRNVNEAAVAPMRDAAGGQKESKEKSGEEGKCFRDHQTVVEDGLSLIESRSIGAGSRLGNPKFPVRARKVASGQCRRFSGSAARRASGRRSRRGAEGRPATASATHRAGSARARGSPRSRGWQ